MISRDTLKFPERLAAEQPDLAQGGFSQARLTPDASRETERYKKYCAWGAEVAVRDLYLSGAQLTPDEQRHQIYVQDVGNPQGIPLLILHGGPAFAMEPKHLAFLDHDRFRSILIHQRGCGLSSPAGEMRANTTDHLIADIELVREHLGYDKINVLGWSWGATLGVAYAERFPENTKSFVGFGSYLASEEEYSYHRLRLRLQHRELADRLSTFTDATEWSSFNETFFEAIGTEREPAAIRSWYYLDQAESIPEDLWDRFRINVWYNVNKFFLQEPELLTSLERVAQVPAHFVHGTNDLWVPLHSSEQLASHWRGAKLTVVPDATHSIQDASIGTALAEILKRID